MNTMRRQTESTNLGPRELIETEPPTKEHARAGPKPPTHLKWKYNLSSGYVP
ncbi:rCG63609 [Rattus norvegicus]|uniref:RCG63609 n=1 Tax=Rattus norvegicus TaxID=10116 RepID=A6JMM7_RAT|nr:rCG63609 [Rattus norvegicus]